MVQILRSSGREDAFCDNSYARERELNLGRRDISKHAVQARAYFPNQGMLDPRLQKLNYSQPQQHQDAYYEIDSSADGEAGVTVFETLSAVGPQESVGGVGHPLSCTPCTFFCFTKKGCNRGQHCGYCHSSHFSRLQQRREDWKQMQRAKRRMARSHKSIPTAELEHTLPIAKTAKQLFLESAEENVTPTVQGCKDFCAELPFCPLPGNGGDPVRKTIAAARVPDMYNTTQSTSGRGLARGQRAEPGQMQARSNPKGVRPDQGLPCLLGRNMHGISLWETPNVTEEGSTVPTLAIECHEVFCYEQQSVCCTQHQTLLLRPVLQVELSHFRLESGSHLPRGLVLDSDTGVIQGTIADGATMEWRVSVLAQCLEGYLALKATVKVEVVNFQDPGFCLGHVEEVRKGIFMFLFHKPGEESDGGVEKHPHQFTPQRELQHTSMPRAPQFEHRTINQGSHTGAVQIACRDGQYPLPRQSSNNNNNNYYHHMQSCGQERMQITDWPAGMIGYAYAGPPQGRHMQSMQL